jgi:hypothetical protein
MGDPAHPPRETPISAELRAEIRAGKARPEQKAAVCSGGASLSPEDRAEMLAILASDPDNAISERAQGVLLTQPMESFRAALARADADPHLFAYCARNLADKPGIADDLAKNVGCPTSHVVQAAAHLTPEGIQALLDNLERLTSDPRLIHAVTQCKNANIEQRNLLGEIDKEAAPLPEIEAETVAKIEPDVVKRETLMQQVSRMNVVQRLTLALKGGRTERILLIHDSNKLIQRSVLQSPRLTDSEVESFASMTNLPGETLRIISFNRTFMKSYAIVKNLVNNPKTPLDVSLRLFPRLNPTDLVKLGSNKNIPETLRSSAVKLHRKRKFGSDG